MADSTHNGDSNLPDGASGAEASVNGSARREGSEHGLDSILEEIDQVVEPVADSVAMAPSVGIPVAGGPMITLPEDERHPGAPQGEDSLRAGLLQAGPVAIAGMVVNGAAALLVIGVARLVSPQAYGEIAQLLGLFFILSMPGSAVLVGVVRRVSSMQKTGHGADVKEWVRKVHRVALILLALEIVVVVLLQGWIARQLSLPNSDGIVLILAAAGVWILLCVDRGLLQSYRNYKGLAGNLLVEGAIRTFAVIALLSVHLGVGGYALGVFLAEVGAALHARWLGARTIRRGHQQTVVVDDGPTAEVEAGEAQEELAGRRLAADVTAAFIGLALLGLLQNIDVLLLGRLDHANVGSYAAISVASKAMVFGALALGAYLLPEATIRWNEGGHAIRQFGVTLIFLAVPATLLLGISILVPRQFLTLVFSAKLSHGAPAFAYLVGAMIFLSFSVLVTNYLFGTGSRWIVFLLAGGAVLALVLVSLADGKMVATARADLIAQAVLACAMAMAFIAIHRKHRGQHWTLDSVTSMIPRGRVRTSSPVPENRAVGQSSADGGAG
jgi:O-antigen/teichoic acid export membrane protein